MLMARFYIQIKIQKYKKQIDVKLYDHPAVDV